LIQLGAFMIGDTNTLTAFLAVWGAILSSITFGWTLYRDLRDRAKIKLTAEVRRIGRRDADGKMFSIEPSQDIPGASDRLFVVVSVVNVGRRPMRWQGLGGHYKEPVGGKSAFVVNARFLPQTLEEQQGHDEFTELDEQFLKDNIRKLTVWDVAGRKWNVPRHDMKQLITDARKYSG
jgi:hypothetical protein